MGLFDFVREIGHIVNWIISLITGGVGGNGGAVLMIIVGYIKKALAT